MGLFGSFGYGVAPLIVVSDKEEGRRRRERSSPYFHIYRAKTWRGTINADRLLLWNLGLECFDFGACVGQEFKHFLLMDEEKHKSDTNDQTRARTKCVQLLPTCTATPKLLPSSILGIWSCTHMDTCEANKQKTN